MPPLNVNLPTDKQNLQQGHTTGHNLTNEAVNRTAAAVDGLSDVARTGRLSDAVDVNDASPVVGRLLAVAAVVDGRPTYILVEPPGEATLPDATALTKGVSRLLGGTADAPSVPWSVITGKPLIPTVPGDIGAQPAGSYVSLTTLTDGLATKANASHLHDAADLTATGVRDSSTVLHGDNVWRTASGGGAPTGIHACKYVNGAYEPRPSVPAGQVWYTGPTEPPTWLDGDIWIQVTPA